MCWPRQIVLCPNRLCLSCCNPPSAQPTYWDQHCRHHNAHQTLLRATVCCSSLCCQDTIHSLLQALLAAAGWEVTLTHTRDIPLKHAVACTEWTQRGAAHDTSPAIVVGLMGAARQTRAWCLQGTSWCMAAVSQSCIIQQAPAWTLVPAVSCRHSCTALAPARHQSGHHPCQHTCWSVPTASSWLLSQTSPHGTYHARRY